MIIMNDIIFQLNIISSKISFQDDHHLKTYFSGCHLKIFFQNLILILNSMWVKYQKYKKLWINVLFVKLGIFNFLKINISRSSRLNISKFNFNFKFHLS